MISRSSVSNGLAVFLSATGGAGFKAWTWISCSSFLVWSSDCLFWIFRISEYNTASWTSIKRLHSLMYMVLVMVSGITEIDRTISLISRAFETGSFSTLPIRSCVLNLIKSVSFFLMYSVNSPALIERANESGSSPRGNGRTFTLMPSSRTMSIPRSEAFIPASSPS